MFEPKYTRDAIGQCVVCVAGIPTGITFDASMVSFPCTPWYSAALQ